MKKHQWTALALAATLLLGVPTLASAARSNVNIAPAFTDISDPAVAESASLLRLLGIVNGTGGTNFNPQGTLSRAEFCKMAVELLGQGDQAAAQMNRTVFRDVPSTHWARGYINVAAQSVTVGESTTPGIIRGDASGYFHPDAPISFAEAVTILVRCLGYTDANVSSVGGAWYAGHLAKARSIELLEGLESLTGEDTLTRAQAARLFENLIYTPTKDSQDLFLKNKLGGSIKDSELILEVKGAPLSAGGWALKTDKSSYVTFHDQLSTDLQGKRCKLVLDEEGNVLTLQPDEDYITKAVRIRSAEARYVITEDGDQLLVSAETPLWSANDPEQTYAKAYKEIVPGTTALFCYDKTDTLVSIYLTGDSATAVTAVAKDASHPFDGAWEGNPTAVYKNGLKASLSDVKPYDVGTYDSRTGVLELSDKKLTGVYENAVPSPVSPDTITVMGCDGLVVLDCALGDLSQFKLGDRITLLLDRSNRVAGVVSADKVSKKALGTAEITISSREVPDGVHEDGTPKTKTIFEYTAKVTTTDGLVFEGRTRISDQVPQFAPGRLWTVSSSELGWLELSSVSSDGVSGDWDVVGMKMGSAHVSPWVAVYDQAENGKLVKVDLDAVTVDTVPANKISFTHLDNIGTVDTVILRDVTGDAYTYGLLSHETFRSGASSNRVTTFANANGPASFTTFGGYDRKDDTFLGLATSMPRINFSSLSSSFRPVAAMELTAHSGVHRTAFGDETVRVDGVDWPLAGNIDDCCYNAKSETWFKSLDACLSYSSTLTVYCDRSPSEGGKVRLVVAE